MVVLLLNFGFLLFIGMEDTENIQTTGDEAKKGDYKNNFPTVGINKDAVLKMFDKVVAFKMEERDLALDKFKRLNDELSTEEFWLNGKSAILYLDSAAKSSSYLGDLAKDVMKVVFKDELNPDGGPSSGAGLSEEDKRNVAAAIEERFKNKRKKNGAALPEDVE